MKRFEKKVFIGFIFISLLVLSVTTYTLVNMSNLINRANADKHSLDILKSIEEIHIACLDIETGVRGYLITGDTSYLRPYYVGNALLDSTLLELSHLDTLDTKYNHDLKYLNKFSSELKIISTQLVEAERSQKTDTTYRSKQIIAAKELMDKIRVTINYIESENRNILQSLNKQNKNLAISTQYSFVITLIVFLASLATLFIIILSEFKRRKKVEQELIETQQFLDSLVEYSPNIIFSKDTRGKYRFINYAFEKFVGKPKSEIIGKADEEIFFKPNTIQLIRNDKEVLSQRRPIVFEEKTTNNSGSESYFLTTKFPIFDKNNEVKFICGISVDITERVVSELILKESTDRIYDLYNNAPCGYLSVARDGLILDINETLLTWLAYERDEIVNKMYFHEFIHDDSKKILYEYSEYVKNKDYQKVAAFDCKYVNKFGDLFIGRTSSSFIFNDQGEFTSSRTVILDVTKLKNAEEDILKLNLELDSNNKQLMSLNSELESFSYSVSHDLRSPLRAIDGFAKIILEDYSNVLDTEGLRLLNIIINNTNKMSILIDDLLDFSRLGRRYINLSNIRLFNMISDILIELNINKRYQIDLDIPKDLIIQGDHSMIKVVFTNLINNAIKYSSKVNSPKIKIYNLDNEHNFIFCVEDNGVGFDMEYKNKLFKVFQRLHSETEYEGTGVGLALVHKIIEKHGAEVWAESIKNVSTKFFLKFPKNFVN